MHAGMLELKHRIQCKVLRLLKSLTHLLSSNSYGLESTLSAEDGMNLFLDTMELMQLKVHDHIMFVFLFLLKKNKPSSAKYIKGKAGMEYTWPNFALGKHCNINKFLFFMSHL